MTVATAGRTAAARGVEGLRCYQLALQLLERAYELAGSLPKHEKYNLASQLRRSALSSVLNIAEGYGRYHYLDKIRFFYVARGSLTETRAAFTAAHTVGYATAAQLDLAHSLEEEAQRSLNGFISFIRRQRQGSSEFGDKALHDDAIEYEIDAIVPRDPDFDTDALLPEG
jgi:four helix bundle protein